MASRHFDPSACFLAMGDGSPVGCVAVTNLPHQNWFAVRYLAAKHSASQTQTAEKLLQRALVELESRKPEYVRGTTPAIEPYVEVYKRAGFKPVRRDFRIRWDLAEPCGRKVAKLSVKPVTEETAGDAGELFVKTLTPLWDWRTSEQGGSKAAADSFIGEVKEGQRFFIGFFENEPVALAGFIPDFYSRGDARFRGAFVHPSKRGTGIGSTMMFEVSRLAREMGQRRMTVYTFSYLDHLAPGALLYLRSGGMIDAEYVQLERETRVVSVSEKF